MNRGVSIAVGIVLALVLGSLCASRLLKSSVNREFVAAMNEASSYRHGLLGYYANHGEFATDLHDREIRFDHLQDPVPRPKFEWVYTRVDGGQGFTLRTRHRIEEWYVFVTESGAVTGSSTLPDPVPVYRVKDSQ
jgi:hypothetical protein